MSRMTVNRALRDLVQQGRIVRVAGVGSFVAQDKPQLDAASHRQHRPRSAPARP
jgi:DNA-binding GntR family transcriptional regulator